MSLFDHGVAKLHTLLKEGDVTVTDLVKESFDRIDATEETVGAFLTLNEDAFEQAKRMDELAKTADNPLFGLPIGVKDNIVTKGTRTTCGSKFLENFVPAHDATVVTLAPPVGYSLMISWPWLFDLIDCILLI